MAKEWSSDVDLPYIATAKDTDESIIKQDGLFKKITRQNYLSSQFELIASAELAADTANFSLDVPDDRKYYQIYFQCVLDDDNAFLRVRFNGVSISDYSYFNHNIFLGTITSQVSNSEISGGLGGSGSFPSIISGTIVIQKIQGINALSFQLDAVSDVTSDPTLAPSGANTIKGKVQTVDNFNKIECFANVGNVAAGSYFEVYASKNFI